MQRKITLPQQQSELVKQGRILSKADNVSDVVDSILTEIQQDKITTFYSKGRQNKKEDEANRAKSYRAFVMIERLCKLCNLEGREFNEEFMSFRKSLFDQMPREGVKYPYIIQTGLKLWADGITNSNDKQTINGAKASIKTFHENMDNFEGRCKTQLEKLRDTILKQTNLTARFMGDLFDYPREITFSLGGKKGVKYKDISTSFRGVANTERTQAGRQAKVIRNNLEQLTDILSRYSEVISAFSNFKESLQKFGRSQATPNADLFHELFGVFIEQEVLNGEQQWNGFVRDEEEQLECPKTLTKEYLLEKALPSTSMEVKQERKGVSLSFTSELIPSTSPRASSSSAAQIAPQSSAERDPAS